MEGTEAGRMLKKALQKGDSFQDEFIIDIVRERLELPDCVVNGWILDGCPLNIEQIMMMRQLLILP